MAKFIQKIYEVFSDLEGKNIATKHPPERIDRVLNLIIQDLFNHYLDHYVKTKKISAYLEPFKRQADVPLVAGAGDLPGDYYLHRALKTPNGLRIDIVEDDKWAYRVNRKIGAPSPTRPIARIEKVAGGSATKLEVVPTSLATVRLLYFKSPTEAKYAYDKVGTKYVYNDGASVDVEFPIGLYPDIIVRLLSHFGIVLREGQLMQITEQLKRQEQIK